MAYKDKTNAIKYNNEFNKQTYDRISLMVVKGKKELIQDKAIKAIDIANKFNVSRPTVSEALIRLADLDLIIYFII